TLLSRLAPISTLFPYSTLFRSSARIFNRMFGGGAASFLFMNLREKLSLAYQIHSELDIKNGVLFAIAGVDFNRVKETEIHVMKRSEEHTSELQSRFDLVCRLLL